MTDAVNVLPRRVREKDISPRVPALSLSLQLPPSSSQGREIGIICYGHENIGILRVRLRGGERANQGYTADPWAMTGVPHEVQNFADQKLAERHVAHGCDGWIAHRALALE